jgi:hypothetical protein
VVESKHGGRVLVATRAVKQGEVLLVENPMVQEEDAISQAPESGAAFSSQCVWILKSFSLLGVLSIYELVFRPIF